MANAKQMGLFPAGRGARAGCAHLHALQGMGHYTCSAGKWKIHDGLEIKRVFSQ